MFLGLGKTLFNSSAALITPRKGERPEITVALSERLSRRKASGAWPEAAIRQLQEEGLRPCAMAENRDVIAPALKEKAMDAGFPFFEYLKTKQLEEFSSHFNSDLQFVTHHLCHAWAATLMSPFEEALIVVLDGAGSRAGDFAASHEELLKHPPAKNFESPHSPPHEECSVYLLTKDKDRPRLECVLKRWGTFTQNSKTQKHFSEGVGIFYETVAEYIFNNSRASGKVMGLAPLGHARSLPSSRLEFAKNLPWESAFTQKGKREWETSPHLSFYKDLAATTQEVFEKEVGALLKDLRQKFPAFSRVILTGGCALNCTFNGKLQRSGLFDAVYVPPFPGDESIGLGAAAFLYFNDPRTLWRPLDQECQSAYFGPKSSEPTEEKIKAVFAHDFIVEKPASITEKAAEILKDGHVVAWFQGRSESGPRSLGHRSLLARPDQKGLKDFLNARIKFRESFRPYGASCSYEHAHHYFNVPEDFHTPYMAFAAPTRTAMKEKLHEVTHTDGTCRYQSVRPGQDRTFYELIQAFGRRTDLFCLLNTSLNIMGEPIVESVEDARNFLLKMNEQDPSPIHGLAIGDFYIRAKGHAR